MRSVGIWTPPGRQPSEAVLGLARQAEAEGGARAWRTCQPGLSVGYAHGERDDLWWEFHLSASFRWQGHLSRLTPLFLEHRQQRLTALFELGSLMNRRVAELRPSERVRANLAVALLHQPDVLVWEHPFRPLSPRDRRQVCQALERLCREDGLTVITVSADTHTGGVTDDGNHETWADDAGHSRRPWPAGRLSGAGHARWA